MAREQSEPRDVVEWMQEFGRECEDEIERRTFSKKVLDEHPRKAQGKVDG